MRTDAAGEDLALRRRVIEPDRSFIVQAPAGSGKTSLLTLRYLRLLAVVERPEEIVAVTFTRKAASEMRHRIVKALRAAAGPPPTGEAQEHERELRRLAVAALARSRECGWGLESNPARLHVQTIDGLNHWLARRLPLAARIGLTASLVDDARPLYAEAGARFIALLDGETPAAAQIDRLARALDHDPQQLLRLIEGMLGTRELWLPKLIGASVASDLRAEIDGLLESAIELELRRTARSLESAGFEQFFDLIREAAAEADADGPLAPLAGLRALPPATLAGVGQWRALADLLLTADPHGALRKTVDRRQGFLAAGAGPRWTALKKRMVAFLGEFAELPDFAAALVRARLLPPARLTDAAMGADRRAARDAAVRGRGIARALLGAWPAGPRRGRRSGARCASTTRPLPPNSRSRSITESGTCSWTSTRTRRPRRSDCSSCCCPAGSRATAAACSASATRCSPSTHSARRM